jgi:hypothetical protein
MEMDFDTWPIILHQYLPSPITDCKPQMQKDWVQILPVNHSFPSKQEPSNGT